MDPTIALLAARFGPYRNGVTACAYILVEMWGQILDMIGDFGTLVIAVAALVVSVWSVLFRSRRRDFEILLGRSDKEAAKREAGRRDLVGQLEKEAAKREAGTRDLMRQLDNEAAKREAETWDLKRQLSEEAAKREAGTRDLMRQLKREAAEREARTRDLVGQLEKEAARREAETRDLRRQLSEEAAEREARTRDLVGQLEKEAARREAETRDLRRQLDKEAAKREAAIQRMFDISERRFSALMERLDDQLEHLAAVSERVARNETALEAAKARGYRTVAAQASTPDESDEEAVQQAPPDQLPE